MTRYKHYVRKTTDAPEVKSAAITTCSGGFYQIDAVAHGYNINDEILISGFANNFDVNGIATITSIAADTFIIDIVCIGAASDTGFIQLVDDATYIEVFPLGFYVSNFKYDQREGQIFFTRKLTGNLTFTNRPAESITDYTLFAQETDECIGYDYIIKQECEGVFYNYYQAIFALSDGIWDRENCTFKVEPFPNTLYDCLLNQKRLNIFNATQVSTLYEAGSNPDRTYTNTRKFDEVLEYLANNTCSGIYGIISDFFQINPETTSSYNYVSGDINSFTSMTLGSVKDIKEPIPSDLQDVLTTTFYEFMLNLNALFNVYFTVQNNFVRIEHVSYFESGQGLDLTLSRYNNYDTGKNKYSYLDVPRTESRIASGNNILQVLYDNYCSIKDQRDEQIENSFITTDLLTLRLLPDRYSGSTEGIVLMATAYSAPNYVVIGSENDELSNIRLFLRFHRHNRAQPAGSLNAYSSISGIIVYYDDFLIYSSKKNKLQEKISIPLCCDDTFNTEDKVLTGLGEGVVESAEFSVKDDRLTLQLKYGSPNVEDIESPTEINGLTAWWDANQGVTLTAGSTVSNWADQSGNGYDFSQATFANRPELTNTFNKTNAGILFDGIDDFMTSPTIQAFPSKRGSIFIVYKSYQPLVAVNEWIIGTSDSSGNLWDISLAVTSSPSPILKTLSSDVLSFPVLYLADLGDYSTKATQEATYGYTDYVLFEIIRDSDTTLTIYGNGSIGGNTEPRTTTISNTQPDAKPISLGRKTQTSTIPFHGIIGEILIYDHEVTDYERQQIEAYFFKKWSLYNYA